MFKVGHPSLTFSTGLFESQTETDKGNTKGYGSIFDLQKRREKASREEQFTIAPQKNSLSVKLHVERTVNLLLYPQIIHGDSDISL